jgi:UV DNA damage endonuclease
MNKIYLGYPSINHSIEGIKLNRTLRQNTICTLEAQKKGSGIAHLQKLFYRNVEDLLKIIEWNVEHKIYFYRISSGIAPHITNIFAICKNANTKSLLYNMKIAAPLLRKIGEIAQSVNMRLTFHPGLHVALSSPNPAVISAALRDLLYHYKLIKLMRLDKNAVIVLHGGGRYDNKSTAMNRWMHVYTHIHADIQKLIVLENDERNYSIDDVLKISALAKKHMGRYIPIVFDIFHYACYNKIYGEKSQSSLATIMPRIVRTWPHSMRIKMHIAEQMPNARLGTHAAYVKSIPRVLLDFPRKFDRPLDLMVESTAHDLAVFYLRDKYKNTNFLGESYKKY